MYILFGAPGFLLFTFAFAVLCGILFCFPIKGFIVMIIILGIVMIIILGIVGSAR